MKIGIIGLRPSGLSHTALAASVLAARAPRAVVVVDAIGAPDSARIELAAKEFEARKVRGDLELAGPPSPKAYGMGLPRRRR